MLNLKISDQVRSGSHGASTAFAAVCGPRFVKPDVRRMKS